MPTLFLLNPATAWTDYDSVAQEVEAIPGVASAKPFIYTQVMVSGPGNISGGVIRGLDLPYH